MRLRAADRRGDARGLGRLHGLDGAPAARHPASPTTRRSRAGRASSSPPTTCTPSSASTTRPARARPTARSHEDGILGLEELRARALRDKKPFDYDSVVEGLRALDRYTLQFTLGQAAPALRDDARRSSTYAAVAREVVEALSATTSWRTRSAPGRIASSRGGAARGSCWRGTRTIATLRYRSEPGPDDAEGQAWARRLNGRRLPLNDGVEIAIVQENQPRWLSFLNGQADFAARPARAVAARRAERQARAQPRQAGHPPAALPEPRRRHVVLQHGRPGRRRLRAGEGRAAPRGPAGVRHRLRDQDHPARPGDPGAGADAAGNLRLRPGAAHATTATTTSRARRRCSTSTATSTATATAGASSPTARRSSSRCRASRSRSTASTTRTGSAAPPRSASAWSSRRRSGPST